MTRGRQRTSRFHYNTEKRGVLIGFGVFILLIGMAIMIAMAVHWRDQPPPHPASIVAAAMFALWGIWQATSYERVTVDPTTRSVAWTRCVFWRAWRTVTWSFDDITFVFS